MSINIFNEIETLSSDFIIVFKGWNLDLEILYRNITIQNVVHLSFFTINKWLGFGTKDKYII